jgi:hypothetical protein
MIKEVKEFHQTGNITVGDNIPKGAEPALKSAFSMHGDLGIQVAKDGRVWICINGLAFLRFSPWPNGNMRPDSKSVSFNGLTPPAKELAK